MKRTALILSVTLVMAMPAGPLSKRARAALTDSAVATVIVRVEPTVAVRANQTVVDAGTIDTGEVSATASFRVDSSVPRVELTVAATGLHKAGLASAEAPEAAPIPLDLARGVLIEPDGGTPLGATGGVAAFGPDGDEIDGLPASRSAPVAIEAAGHVFAGNVAITVTWVQADPDKPTGEYRGAVKLIATVLP